MGRRFEKISPKVNKFWPKIIPIEIKLLQKIRPNGKILPDLVTLAGFKGCPKLFRKPDAAFSVTKTVDKVKSRELNSIFCLTAELKI